jgi:hypothetical protein
MATTSKSAAKKSAARKASPSAGSTRKKPAAKKAAKKAIPIKKTAKKAASKAPAKKAIIKQTSAKKAVKKSTARKSTTPAPAKQGKVAGKTPVAKSAAASRTVPKPASAAKRIPARTPSASPPDGSGEPAHISPDQAVAHIQALLQAKQERIKRGPAWPGAKPAPKAVNGSSQHGGSQALGAVHHLAHARGDQPKGKN